MPCVDVVAECDRHVGERSERWERGVCTGKEGVVLRVICISRLDARCSPTQARDTPSCRDAWMRKYTRWAAILTLAHHACKLRGGSSKQRSSDHPCTPVRPQVKHAWVDVGGRACSHLQGLCRPRARGAQGIVYGSTKGFVSYGGFTHVGLASPSTPAYGASGLSTDFVTAIKWEVWLRHPFLCEW